jgi:hypothetical protein
MMEQCVVDGGTLICTVRQMDTTSPRHINQPRDVTRKVGRLSHDHVGASFGEISPTLGRHPVESHDITDAGRCHVGAPAEPAAATHAVHTQVCQGEGSEFAHDSGRRRAYDHRRLARREDLSQSRRSPGAIAQIVGRWQALTR